MLEIYWLSVLIISPLSASIIMWPIKAIPIFWFYGDYVISFFFFPFAKYTGSIHSADGKLHFCHDNAFASNTVLSFAFRGKTYTYIEIYRRNLRFPRKFLPSTFSLQGGFFLHRGRIFHSAPFFYMFRCSN